MVINSSYFIKLKDINKTLKPTIIIYREALKFILEVLILEYEPIKDLSSKKQINTVIFGCAYDINIIENLIHTTKKNTAKYKDFDTLFYKYPSYLRRSTIMDALGIYKSYSSNYENWELTKQGNPPKLNTTHNKYPCFLNKKDIYKTKYQNLYI